MKGKGACNMYEIFLTKKYTEPEDWKKLLDSISRMKTLQRWQIVVNISMGKIRYFIDCPSSLPPSLKSAPNFILKKSASLVLPHHKNTIPVLSDGDDNILDIIEKSQIKKRGTIEYIVLQFYNLTKKKRVEKMYLLTSQNGLTYKRDILFANSNYVLSINFAENNRYTYKSSPKYLNVSKHLNRFHSKSASSLFKVDAFPYREDECYLSIADYSFAKHSLVIGTSGSGKSKFLSYLVTKILDYKEEYKVVVIDPHANLASDIGGLGKVIDFQSKNDSIDVFSSSTSNSITETETTLDLFSSLIASQYNAKLERVLRHSLYLLLEENIFDWNNLRKILLDSEYRNGLISSCEENLPTSVCDFFRMDFVELKNRSYNEAISPIISFIDEMQMLPVFNGTPPKDNLENVLDQNDLLLFSLNEAKLGHKITKTISGLIMQRLFSLLQSHKISKKTILIIDEVAVIENPILTRFLSEARKYGLALILAGQYFNQISEDLKSAIFSNVVNYYLFRVSKSDASVLEENIAISIPADNTKEAKISLLSGLKNRELIVRLDDDGTLMNPIKCSTLDFEGFPRVEQVYEEKIEYQKQTEKKEIVFDINSDINVIDIMKMTSTSRKVIK